MKVKVSKLHENLKKVRHERDTAMWEVISGKGKVSKLKKNRKEIARVLTEINSKSK